MKNKTDQKELTLYHYFRSSCSFRVRIALNYKKLPYKVIPINLLEGEQKEANYLKLNPMGFVPTLFDHHESGSHLIPLGQSLAIMEYLEEKYPHKFPLLPTIPHERAIVRALAQIIICDTQPIQNLRVLNYLIKKFSVSEKEKIEFARHFIQEGLSAYEKMVLQYGGTYSFGSLFSLADIALVPQVFNAKRFEVDLSPYPKINQIMSKLMTHPFISQASPENYQ